MKALFAIALLFLVACTENAQIANPASKFCEDNGGFLDIITNDDGSQVGICTLESGKKCEEWAYYRGECPKDYEIAEVTDVSCGSDSDCETPQKYLILSSCPYTSKCINGMCTVICPNP